MTETGAKTISGIALGVVGLFLIVVVVAGLGASGFQTAAGATAAASRGSAAAGGGAGNAVHGRQLFQQFNCSGCHSVDGSAGVGPTLKGLAGSPVPLDDGTTVTADDNYLKVSIQQPNAQIVKGYMPNTMLSAIMAYQSQLSQDATVNDLVAYIKTLK